MTGAPVHPHRVVGDRSGVAALGSGSRRRRPAAPAAGAGQGGQAGPPRARRRRGRHRGDHGGDHDAAPRRVPAPHEPTAEELARTYPPGSRRHRERRRPPAPPVPVRARLAGRASTAVSAVSRRLGLGGGSVIGGRVGLLIAPDLLGTPGRRPPGGPRDRDQRQDHHDPAAGRAPSAGRRGWRRRRPAPTCRPGWPAALASARPGAPAVLEVDEGYLGAVAQRRAPRGDGAAQPVARPARPRERGPHGRGALARRCSALDRAPPWSPTPMTRWWCGGHRARPTWCGWRPGSCGTTTPWVARRATGRIVFAGGRLVVRVRVLGRPAPRRRVCAVRRPRDRRRSRPSGRARAAGALQPGQRGHGRGGRRGARDRRGRGARGDGVGHRGRGTLRHCRRTGARSVRLLLAKNPAGWTELLDLLEGGTDPGRDRHQCPHRRRA